MSDIINIMSSMIKNTKKIIYAMNGMLNNTGEF